MNSEVSQAGSLSPRVASLDVMRGLTILLMVFVNDLGPAAPAWMHHIQPFDADGMTLADIVFPFFLFIAGASIPLAADAALQRGHSRSQMILHVITRSFALILMGLIGVNRADEIRVGPDYWGLLGYVSIILAWTSVPDTSGHRLLVFRSLKVAGVLGLIAVFGMFRRAPVATEVLFYGHAAEWIWLTTSWWGILGLIGWSYLAVALLYLVLGPRREWLMAATGFLMLNFLVAQHGGFFTRIDDKSWLTALRPGINWLQNATEWLNSYVSLKDVLGSLPATMMAGCLLGVVLRPSSDIGSPHSRIRWSLTFAAGLFLAGAMTDTFAGVNKIAATPTWCFWCASLATLSWLALYVIIDISGYSKWTTLVRPAGANPLLAYLLHPIILFVLSLTGLGSMVRAYASSTPMIAIAGSAAMALTICGLTATMARCGIRLRV